MKQWGVLAMVWTVGMCVAGCTESLKTKVYVIGDRPQTTIAIVEMITEDEAVRQFEEHEGLPGDRHAVMAYKRVETEGTIVVHTTAEGHRKITAALSDLNEAVSQEADDVVRIPQR